MDSKSEVSVISLGGARINDVFDIVKNELDRLSTFVVIIHIGTNDVNKVYEPVKDMHICAKEGLRYLFQNIKQLQVYHGFAVVFSGCLYTKSPIINERIDELNKYLYSMCRQCEYYSVDHSNILVHFFKRSGSHQCYGRKDVLESYERFCLIFS